MKAVTEFTSPEEAALELDLPLLGTLPSPESTTGAVAASFPNDPDARREYYHAIGRVLQSPLARHGSLGLVGDVEASRRANVSSWLAASIAAERTVVLIDADLRGAHLSFDDRGRAQEGLVDVLRYGVRSPRVVSPTRTAGLNLLPVGSGTMDLTGTFGSGAVPSLFEELKRTGDLIVINGPALGDFQAAAPFLAQVSGWILLHELGTSDSHKTRMLRQTFGKEKCLGVIALMGQEQGAVARGAESAVETVPPDLAVPTMPGAAGAFALEAERGAVTPTPEEIAAWTAETMGTETTGASDPDARTEPVAARPMAPEPRDPSPARTPPPVPPPYSAPSVAKPSSTPTGSLPPPPPLPPRDTVRAKPPPSPPKKTQAAPVAAGTSSAAPKPAAPKPAPKPSASAPGSGSSGTPTSPRESRRMSPVVWVVGAAAILIGGYFLVQDRIPDWVGASRPVKSPLPVAGERDRDRGPGTGETPGEPVPAVVGPVGPAPASSPSGDATASAGPTEEIAADDVATPVADRIATGLATTPGSGPTSTGSAAATPESGTTSAGAATAPPATSPPATSPPVAGGPKVDRSASVGSAAELYYVHVSSLSTHDSAEIESARLQRAGYPTGLKRFDLGARGVWWRVYVGPYGERADANAAADAVKERKLSDYTQVYRLEREGVEVGTGQENR